MNSTSYNSPQKKIIIPPSKNLWNTFLKPKGNKVFNLPVEETAYSEGSSPSISLTRPVDDFVPSKSSLTESVGALASSPFKLPLADKTAYEINSVQRKKVQVLTYEDMERVREENKKDNWDGYGAIGITDEHFNSAKEFVNELFESDLSKDILKLIEINPENYGNIAFDWFVDHDHQISISIRDNKAVFTYIFDKKKYYGETPISELDFIKDFIESLYE